MSSLHWVYRKNVKKSSVKLKGKGTKAWIEGILVAMWLQLSIDHHCLK